MKETKEEVMALDEELKKIFGKVQEAKTKEEKKILIKEAEEKIEETVKKIWSMTYTPEELKEMEEGVKESLERVKKMFGFAKEILEWP